MNKKGFTLFETMVSITIFSVLMVIVFNCWTEFQKASIKNEGKQDTNIQFVNVYRNIDKLVSSSSTRLFQCYVESEIASDKRWFAFLLSRKDNQLDGKCIFETRTFTLEGIIICKGLIDVPAQYNIKNFDIIYNPDVSAIVLSYLDGWDKGISDYEIYLKSVSEGTATSTIPSGYFKMFNRI